VTDSLKLEIVGSAIRAWRDAFAVFAAMPALFVVAIALVAMLDGSITWLPPTGDDNKYGSGTILGSLMVAVIRGLILTPVAVAVHRYVLLGETAPNYRINL
jgi:hypothetical protein